MAATNYPGAEAPTSKGDLVLVTGASGFIGSALVKHLVETGWRVRALLRRVHPHLGMPAALTAAVAFDRRLDPFAAQFTQIVVAPPRQ